LFQASRTARDAAEAPVGIVCIFSSSHHFVITVITLWAVWTVVRVAARIAGGRDGFRGGRVGPNG
jgi:hypothetical protein